MTDRHGQNERECREADKKEGGEDRDQRRSERRERGRDKIEKLLKVVC